MTSARPIGALFTAFALIAPAARAQPTSPPNVTAALGELLVGEAKEAYQSGKVLFFTSDFAGALAKFRHAYELSREPRLLYDMAVCEKNLGHYARMEALLQHYLDDAGATLSVENRARIQDALAAIKDLVVALGVTVNVAGATLLIDGEPAGITPLASPLTVDVGKHTIVVKKPGFEPLQQVIETTSGSPKSMSFTLVLNTRSARLVVTAGENSTVILDDTVVGKGQFDAQLVPGEHEIRVTESGKRAYAAKIELKEAEQRTLQVTLADESRGLVWPWVVGGAVVAGGVAVGGYFLLRPQDAVAPRTGTLGSVQFHAWRSQ